MDKSEINSLMVAELVIAVDKLNDSHVASISLLLMQMKTVVELLPEDEQKRWSVDFEKNCFETGIDSTTGEKVFQNTN